MQKLSLGLTTLLVIFILATVSLHNADISKANAVSDATLQPMTVRGLIWDNTCAAAGSHGKMMPKVHAKDAKECTLGCVAAGGQLVLFDSDDKIIYRLDSQDKARPYAGQTVTVKGNYDPATGILHMESIDSAPWWRFLPGSMPRGQPRCAGDVIGGRSCFGFWLYSADWPGGMVRYFQSGPRNALATYTICPT